MKLQPLKGLAIPLKSGSSTTITSQTDWTQKGHLSTVVRAEKLITLPYQNSRQKGNMSFMRYASEESLSRNEQGYKTTKQLPEVKQEGGMYRMSFVRNQPSEAATELRTTDPYAFKQAGQQRRADRMFQTVKKDKSKALFKRANVYSLQEELLKQSNSIQLLNMPQDSRQSQDSYFNTLNTDKTPLINRKMRRTNSEYLSPKYGQLPSKKKLESVIPFLKAHMHVQTDEKQKQQSKINFNTFINQEGNSRSQMKKLTEKREFYKQHQTTVSLQAPTKMQKSISQKKFKTESCSPVRLTSLGNSPTIAEQVQMEVLQSYVPDRKGIMAHMKQRSATRNSLSLLSTSCNKETTYTIQPENDVDCSKERLYKSSRSFQKALETGEDLVSQFGEKIQNRQQKLQGSIIPDRLKQKLESNCRFTHKTTNDPECIHTLHRDGNRLKTVVEATKQESVQGFIKANMAIEERKRAASLERIKRLRKEKQPETPEVQQYLDGLVEDQGEKKAILAEALSKQLFRTIELLKHGEASQQDVAALEAQIKSLNIDRCNEYLISDIYAMQKQQKVTLRQPQFTSLNKFRLSTLPDKSCDPLVLLQKFNRDNENRDKKRIAIHKKRGHTIIKKIKKLQRECEVKIETEKEVESSESDLTNESQQAREEMTTDAEEMMRELQAQLRARQTGGPVLSKKEEIREKAQLITEEVFRDCKNRLNEDMVDQKALEAFEAHRNRVKERIGLQLYLIYIANKKMQTRYLRKKGQEEEWLNQHIAGIVDKQRRELMRFSIWKDVKRNKRERNESETSYDGEVDSDMELKNALDEKAMGQVKQEKFYKVFHSSKDAGAAIKYENDYDFIYQKSVDRSLEPQLPIPAKINNGILALQDYTLSIGQCRAMAQVFHSSRSNYIKHLMLDNCGVDDSELAAILDGLEFQAEFRTLSYKHSEFLEKSLEAIKPILLKPPLENLYELRLNSCKTVPAVLENLCKFISGQANQLRSLKLISLHLSASCVSNLATLIKNSVWLEQLDLSRNGLLPPAFVDLLSVISKNRNLRWLNLSQNSMVRAQDQLEKGDIAHLILSKTSRFAAIRTYVRAKTTEVNELRRAKKKAGSESYPELVARSLGEFIRHNTALQYLDLDSTGLSHKIASDLIPAFERAKGLLSFHIGFNPGFDRQLRRLFNRKLKTHKAPSHVPEISIPKPLALSAREENLYLLEGIELGGIGRDKHIWKVAEEAENMAIYKDFAFTRVLGHKEEMPGQGRWKKMKVKTGDECWIRNLHCYSLLLWSKAMPVDGIQPEEGKKQEFIDKILEFNEQRKRTFSVTSECGGRTVEVPVVCCDGNKWQAEPMIPMLKYLELHSNIRKPLDQSFNLARATDLEKRLVEEFGVSEFEISEENSIYKSLKKKIMQELQLEYEKQLCSEWQKIIECNLRYKKPFLMNQSLVDLDPKNTFVLPILLKPGKNNFFIFTDNGTQSFYNRHLIPVRKEYVPPYAKNLLKNKKERIFDFKKSVFRKWTVMNDKLIKKCLIHDRKYWKVSRITKNPTVESALAKIIQKNFYKLNELFLEVASTGKFPLINMQEFLRFCSQMKIQDQYCTLQNIQVYFISVNVELGEEQDGNDDSQLCRFEFMEMLIRIAKGKYIDPGFEQSLPLALERLLDEYILKFYDEKNGPHHWRAGELWSVQINDLFEENSAVLKRFYMRICKKENPSSKRVLRTTMVDLFMQIDVPRRIAMKAFAFSKMIVANENEDGPLEYESIKPVECMEMIARVAHLQYLGTDFPLQKKVFSVMEALLNLEGMTAVMPDRDSQTESETDQDY